MTITHAVVEGHPRRGEIPPDPRGSPTDRHLQAFREEYGDAVVGCLLLHDGPETFRISEGIVATPWWRVL